MTHLLDYAAKQAELGTIDSLKNLKNKPVYLYRGTKDAFYLKGSLENSVKFFDLLEARVHFNSTTPSGHSWPTYNYGTPCGTGVIEKCHYDGIGAALEHIYGKLNPPIDAHPNRLVSFDQAPFMTANNNVRHSSYSIQLITPKSWT